MCRELDMENAFDAVMADLGTGAESLISLEEFVRRGLAVHSESVPFQNDKFEPRLSLSNNNSDVEDFDSGLIMASGASNSGPTSCESLCRFSFTGSPFKYHFKYF